jgi:hypothetical protein
VLANKESASTRSAISVPQGCWLIRTEFSVGTGRGGASAKGIRRGGRAGDGSLLADAEHLTGLKRFERNETVRDQRQQVPQSVRFRRHNQDGNFPSCEILFIFEAAIDGQQHFEFDDFRSAQESTVLPTRKARVLDRLTIMTGKRLPKPLIHALVEQNAHNARGR